MCPWNQVCKANMEQMVVNKGRQYTRVLAEYHSYPIPSLSVPSVIYTRTYTPSIPSTAAEAYYDLRRSDEIKDGYWEAACRLELLNKAVGE